MKYFNDNIEIQTTAIIKEGNSLGENVSIGWYTIIGKNVKIGQNTKIGNGVIIHDGTTIGSNVRIDDNAVIGKLPMSVSTSALKIDNNLSGCNIGDNCIIGTAAILYRGCNIGSSCLIADISTIRENVSVGDNTIIGRGVAVENNCIIGSHCKLETNSYITAYSELEDYVFIAPGVVTSNDNYAARLKDKEYSFKGVTVKRGGRIGAQATILPGKVISEDAFAAAGSVITKDIPAKKINCGNPAKYLRDVPEDQLIDNQ
ncbi:DapH/DapD/GlmU-related protein [Clostridium sp. OS1-26]|uniref:N-acetyltransferase n=1 Tax=Clostridium sp. OS1-26 TaxID=3070681 RepID=UPI0027DFA358|nr:DapH/DapD/GlmU-related protein [Clostridium sp. OS1-26]WML35864.1 DapH/DapD/GlmU-related protein [Clostridium sp. OS1-26]